MAPIRLLVEAKTQKIVTAYRLGATLGLLDAAKLGLEEGDPAVEIKAAAVE